MTVVENQGNERVARSKTASAVEEAQGEDYGTSHAAGTGAGAAAPRLAGATQDAAGAAGVVATLGPVDACCLVERKEDEIMKRDSRKYNTE
eukprot:evm.model.NODE_40510_length_5491_cov_36.110363.1